MLALKDLLLREPALTLATAESMTCGRIQARIGAISGASKFFLGGITTYTIDQKVHHLGVDRALAESCNAVSSEIAEQMAIGACQLFGASLGVATTGYAENPVGRTHPFAWWALAHYLGDGRMAVQSGLIECPGAARTVAQDAAASAALSALVRYLHTLRP